MEGDKYYDLAREISKIHEEICRDKISNLINIVDGMKGEFVLVVDGCHDEVDYSDLSIIEHVKIYVEDGMLEKDAVKLVAKERGIAKSIVYNEYHHNKEV